jgi:GR25 family glycosyltransferase involved in LPS biosynthesis
MDSSSSSSHREKEVKVCIVTLPEYTERLTKLEKLRHDFSTIGFETTLFNGVNGKDITLQPTLIEHVKTVHYAKDEDTHTYTYDASIRINKKEMSKGEFGCALSHLKLLKQLVAEGPDVNYYLILEDDVQLLKPIEAVLELLQHIPADADMCHLAKSEYYPFTKTKQINSCFYESIKHTYFNRTTAYIMSKKGAEKVLAYSNNHIDIPIDDLYNTIYRKTDFRFYIPGSYFFKEQENVKSCIVEINK